VGSLLRGRARPGFGCRDRPHAGYVFSGATAGKAFAPLAGSKPTRVIILGPSHYAGFAGGALPDRDVTAFATPLGEMPVDREAVAKLPRCPSSEGLRARTYASTVSRSSFRSS